MLTKREKTIPFYNLVKSILKAVAKVCWFFALILALQINADTNEKAPPKYSDKRNLDPAAEQFIPSVSTENNWKFLHPYTAKYTAFSGNNRLGSSLRELDIKDSVWTLKTKAKLKRFFIKVNSIESSDFSLQNNLLQPSRFYSKTKITFKKPRIMEQSFDWKKKMEIGKRGKKKWQIPIEINVFDRNSHLLQLRSDMLIGKHEFSYKVSYKGKIQIYEYKIDKTEKIDTLLGSLETTKLIRIKNNGDKFVVWLAVDLNYFPIKIAQYEKDKPEIILLIDSLQYQSQQSID